MQRRYFDNAATSFPKPPEVAGAMADFLTRIGAPGRGLYDEAREAGAIIERCRGLVKAVTGAPRVSAVVFGLNATDGLNLAIKGVLERTLRRTDSPVHVVSTSTEHNSVLRPLSALQTRWGGRLEWTRVASDPATGIVDPADIQRAIRPGRTRLVAINHASNVTGALQDIHAIGAAITALGLDPVRDDRAPLFLVDASQSLGHVPVNMQAAGAHLLAFPGHKGLLGPQGTGGLVIAPGIERHVDTIREGGTGSSSEDPTHPDKLPEKYEAGSHNTVGLAGLCAGIKWLLARTVESVREHEIALGSMLLDGLTSSDLPGVRLLGRAPMPQRVGVFSVVHDTLAPAELATILETEFGILTRPGLHCAPLVHEQFGTSPPKGRGATRFSLGPFLTLDDTDYAIGAIRAITGAESRQFARAK